MNPSWSASEHSTMHSRAASPAPGDGDVRPNKQCATENQVMKGETELEQYWHFNAIDLQRDLKVMQSQLSITQAKYNELSMHLQEQQKLMQQMTSLTQASVEGTVEEMGQFVASMQEQVSLLVSRHKEHVD